MLLEVTVQVGLLTEATVAQVALERLLLVVDVANVTLQVGRDAEGAVAVFTPAGKIETFHKQLSNDKNGKIYKLPVKYNCKA